jgi:hypothetical protein
MEKQKNASNVPYKMDEAKVKEMEARLEIIGNRIEVLEWLGTYTYFFPDWLKIINEAVLEFITEKQ